MSDEWGEHNIYREAPEAGGEMRVHVMKEMCATCIFNPHTRPVEGSRVAGMVRETKDVPGSSVVCHHTLMPTEDGRVINATCRGWYDRLSQDDPVFRMARAMDMIIEQAEVSC